MIKTFQEEVDDIRLLPISRTTLEILKNLRQTIHSAPAPLEGRMGMLYQVDNFIVQCKQVLYGEVKNGYCPTCKRY